MLEVIEKLLILQDRDRRIRHVNSEILRIEPERKMFQARTAEAQAALDAAKARVRQFESDRKALELEVETKKQQIARYANQQLETRKNEEYRALTHEIDACKAEIFKIEDREIELMEQAEAGQREIARATQAANEARQRMEDQLLNLERRAGVLAREVDLALQARAGLGLQAIG